MNETKGMPMIRFVRMANGQPRLVTLPRWAIILVLVAAGLLGIVLLTFAFAFALIAIPVVLIGGAVAAWFGRGKRIDPRRPAPYRNDMPRHEPRPDVIDADYRVIERSSDQPPR